MIKFNCAECGNPFRVPDEFAGRAGRCKICSAVIVVPQSDGSVGVDHATPAWVDHFERIIGHTEQMRREEALRFKALYTRYQEIKKYARSLRQQEEQWAHVNARLEEAHEELNKVSDELDAARKAQGAAESERDHFKTELAELRQSLDDEREARIATQESLAVTQVKAEEAANLKNECNQLRTERDEAQATIASLREELRTLEATSDPEAAHARLIELHDQIDALRRQADEERAGRNIFASRMADMSAHNARLEETITAAEASLTQYKAAKAEIEARAGQIQEHLDDERTDHAELRGRFEALKEEQQRLADELTAARERRDEHERALNSTIARLARQEEELRQANAEKERLSAAIAPDDETGREALKARLVEAHEEEEWLVSQVAEANQALGSLNEQLAVLEKEKVDLAKALVYLRTGNELLQAQLTELMVRHEDVDSAYRERDEALDHLREVETQLERIKAEYEAAYQSSDSSESQAAQAALEAERHAEEADALRAQVQALEEERDTLRVRSEQAERHVEELEAECAGVSDIRHRADALANELSAARAAREESALAVERIAAELASSSKHLGSVEEHTGHLERQIEALTQERDAAQRDAETLQQRIAELEDNLAFGGGQSSEAHAPTGTDDDTLIPELLDDSDNEIIDVLMRFMKSDDDQSDREGSL